MKNLIDLKKWIKNKEVLKLYNNIIDNLVPQEYALYYISCLIYKESNSKFFNIEVTPCIHKIDNGRVYKLMLFVDDNDYIVYYHENDFERMLDLPIDKQVIKILGDIKCVR